MGYVSRTLHLFPLMATTFVLVTVSFSASANPDRYDPQGWEDIITCNTDTESANRTINALYDRSIVDPPLNVTKAKEQRRFPEPIKIFEREAVGYSILSGFNILLHISVIFERPVDGLKTQIEQLTSREFVKPYEDNPWFINDLRDGADGIPFGPVHIEGPATISLVYSDFSEHPFSSLGCFVQLKLRDRSGG